jgi:hypothetical protein
MWLLGLVPLHEISKAGCEGIGHDYEHPDSSGRDPAQRRAAVYVDLVTKHMELPPCFLSVLVCR